MKSAITFTMVLFLCFSLTSASSGYDLFDGLCQASVTVTTYVEPGTDGETLDFFMVMVVEHTEGKITTGYGRRPKDTPGYNNDGYTIAMYDTDEDESIWEDTAWDDTAEDDISWDDTAEDDISWYDTDEDESIWDDTAEESSTENDSPGYDTDGSHSGNRLAEYYSNSSNYRNVYNDVMGWYGTTSNGCVAFMSTALRQVGYSVPKHGRDARGEGISLVTRPFSNYLEGQLGFQRINDARALKPGDVVFTTDAPRWPGYPAHTYMFQSWADQSQGLAYVVDNQGSTHIRNIWQHGTFNFSPFRYALRPTAR